MAEVSEAGRSALSQEVSGNLSSEATEKEAEKQRLRSQTIFISSCLRALHLYR
jgi:hypothetical protein